MERLDKIISNRTGISRKDAKAAISAGKVTVSGKIIRSSDFKVGENDEIFLGCNKISGNAHIYIVLNKPKGYVSATEDPQQKTVIELVPPELFRNGIFPAGRLDKDTTGLLILTNDGGLAHSLLDPKRHVWKRYIATVEGRLDESDVQAFAEGVELKDFTAKPAALRILEAGDEQSRAEVEVREGKFHQVKRMFGARGHEVTALHRAAFGPLTIPEDMKVGDHVRLTEEQVELLRKAVAGAAEEK